MKLKKRHLMLVVTLVLPLAFAGAHGGQTRSMGRSPADNAARARIADDFSKAILVAKDNYAGQLDFNKVTKASITGMLRTLDPHSMYFDRQQWEDFQNDQSSRYYGIGSSIIQHQGKVYIISPTEATASYRAGLRYGDHIAGINGESTEGWTQAQVRSKLLGPEGTTVVVKINRLGVDKPLEFKLTRGPVPLPSVANYFMLGGGVGYVNLERGFNTTTYDEVSRALGELRQHAMTSLVLDLRSNHGGLVDQAQKVSNLFLYRGQKILSMRGRVLSSRDFVASNTNPEDYPIVVLINRYSASAAEIVAGALQDHDRARLVGENSFGKGLVQSPFQLSDQSALVLTTGHYYTPSGRLIQRDYSARSFYDYNLKRGDKNTVHTEEKHTDAGRTVYGGGGIDPDVEVKIRIPQQEQELQRVWFDPIFEFAHQLAAGQIANCAEFRLDRQADHHHWVQPNEYQVGEKVLVAFKSFLRDHRQFKLDDKNVDKDAEYVKRQIRYEMITAAYGVETAYQVLLEPDVQMQRALAEIPKARIMAEDLRRLRSARDGEPRRN
ncbi:MAG TPA: S41 family peptidase [Blastocatellia bacterium]|nr:S41 family peptidase [Blastocatellia bacterium]